MQQLCNPTEIALKGFFLGPQSENAEWFQDRLNEVLSEWFAWRRDSFQNDGRAISERDQKCPEFLARQTRFRELLAELSQRLAGEVPKHSPRYVGHMFSELSMPGLLGHIVTLLHNPNLISRESAPVAAELEKEAIAALGEMLGWSRTIGHFTSGGTVANFEALTRAQARLYAWLAVGACAGLSLQEACGMGWSQYDQLRQHLSVQRLEPYSMDKHPHSAWPALQAVYGAALSPPALVLSERAHYSWDKASRLFGVGQDNLYRIKDRAQWRTTLSQFRELGKPILAVVSVAGTTETGAIDPIDEIDELLHGQAIWHHVDAAFGGFFCTLLGMPENPLPDRAQKALTAIQRATSVTLDPHKLGYVPYSSGAFLAADVRDYTCVRTLAPYIDYDLSAGDRGPYTLEGSRSAAGAVSTWLTARTIGLNASGYGLLLARTLRQKNRLESFLQESSPLIQVVPHCDTNILCFTLALVNEPVSQSNRRCLGVLRQLATEKRYYLSKTQFSREQSQQLVSQWAGQWDCAELTLLRLCLMNPFLDAQELTVRHLEDLAAAILDSASGQS